MFISRKVTCRVQPAPWAVLLGLPGVRHPVSQSRAPIFVPRAISQVQASEPDFIAKKTTPREHS